MIHRIGLLLGLTFAVLGGCAIDTAVDCANMCDRYSECFDPEADESACTSRCESRVEAGEDDRADECDTCLDDNDTCGAALVACAGVCGPLLAP